jgi:cation-transporting ATPase E
MYPLGTPNMLMLEMFVIGIPSFFLAFLPNDKPVEGKFIFNLFKNALPGALTLIINTAAIYIFCLLVDGSVLADDVLPVITSMITIVITFSGLAMLAKLCKPFRPLTAVLCVVELAICLILTLTMSSFFEITTLDLSHTLFSIILILLAPTIINVMSWLVEKIKFN